jgi:hypothetical protein
VLALVLLLLAGLAFLFPIATYCLFLAVVNAREHPTMISGPWDFLGVLFATSGFLLAGGPLLISLVQTSWRQALALGQVGGSAQSWWLLGVLLWLGYFAALIGGALWLLRRRRAFTVIYNIDPALFDEALRQVLDHLHLQSARAGNRLTIRTLGHPTMETELEIDPFPSLHNVTLHWRVADGRLRQEIEAELGRLFRGVSGSDNPSAGWFLTIATCLFGAVFLGLLAFIMLQVRR